MMKKLVHDIKSLGRVASWMLFIQLTFNIGSFLVVPFIAVYLHQKLGFSLAFVGLQLTIKLLSQRGLMLIGGIITDRVGAIRGISLGIVIRALSFLLYMVGQDAVTISIGSAAFGLGGALFIPSAKAALTAAVTPAHKQLVFSLRSTAGNLGMAIGGLLGGVLMDLSQSAIFASATVIQLACGILVFHPNVRKMQIDFVQAKQQRVQKSAIATVGNILAKPAIAMVALLYAAYIALYSQFEFTLPLAAAALYNSKAVGLLFFVNTVMVFLFQIPLNHFLSERLAPEKTVALGFLCIALAVVGFSFSLPLPFFLAMAALFSLGEIVIDPSVDALSSANVNAEDLGTLFGLFGVVALAGGTLGNFIGSRYFSAPAGGVLWAICAAIAILSVGLSVYQSRLQPKGTVTNPV